MINIGPTPNISTTIPDKRSGTQEWFSKCDTALGNLTSTAEVLIKRLQPISVESRSRKELCKQDASAVVPELSPTAIQILEICNSLNSLQQSLETALLNLDI